ncbi:50S ribosomal protein L11 methyltransferase [Candidatus Methylopumilus planktonicus]|uniref:50S ribosomal protein L11 methyltransferase n=1 Tax=Candidatus Methylopumilus planktonicus TaxID=1581557 RepID=UPI001123574C|nr:50S ribosomal protein L11 methyltransferase [Candidatus Methylopumilus planktonicus]QDD06272.1 50S ribosomal protein L11 methyltransferase [Candidatus Methylopumilus planktonicus]QDD07607.1 50S ribosomal protein L11 methyltransferase [Candidatus Methylopumilus planktonicus]QDD08934.1 50S ribosomal protein L11 methyltransferase [Candidatus Methylopumilus planktonicus]
MAAWINLKIRASADYANIMSDALIELGALSCAIEDSYLNSENEEALFGEPNIPSNTIWQHNTVESLFDAAVSIDTIINELKTITGLPHIDYTLDTVEEQNWVALTQSQFEPINIFDKLWIVPSWHTSPNPDAINIILDPGLAFGTGSHPTTHLCLEWLIKEVNINDHVLDYGCGSGILSIAAKKCGAKQVIGVDIDPQAIIASIHNAKENHVDVQFYNSELPLTFEADIVVANILSSALSVLAPLIAKACKPHGKIALSGILKEQIEMLTEIYSRWFDLNNPIEREGWILLSGTKKSIS